jgi:predicted dithiol-disulfide oxidoreductase (DUF899 family)
MSTIDAEKLERDIAALEEEIQRMKKELVEKRKSLPRMQVSDYALGTPDGQTRLSELFAGHDELIVIHNMGKGCRWCTLWADGFNGIVDHFENRAGFALVSPDDPQAQKAFAQSRGWKFRVLSGKGSTFIEDLGFRHEKGGFIPGFSTFVKDESGKIFRIAKAEFGPGDDYCSIWHMFDLLSGGVGDWEPQYKY